MRPREQRALTTRTPDGGSTVHLMMMKAGRMLPATVPPSMDVKRALSLHSGAAPRLTPSGTYWLCAAWRRSATPGVDAVVEVLALQLAIGLPTDGPRQDDSLDLLHARGDNGEGRQPLVA